MSIRNKFQDSVNTIVFLLITFSLVFSSLNTCNILQFSDKSASEINYFPKKEFFTQNVQKNISKFQINSFSSNEEPIPYFLEQSNEFDLELNQMKQILTTSNTNISINSKVKNSSFQILSTGNTSINEWQNGIEPDYGYVNVSTFLSEDETVFQLNYSDNSVTPASGITNTKFLGSFNPNVTSSSTIISFDFRIPYVTPGFLSTLHTLVLDFRFNNGSISFILSDFGGSIGEILEENITRPNGSDTLFILCNDTVPFSWKHISYNITRLVTTYFDLEDYIKFSELTTLFCYLISFSPEFQLCLDLNNIEYFASLPCNPPINYSIGETTVFSENGSLSFESALGNFTFCAYEDSPRNNSQTCLEVNISRIFNLESFCWAENWNKTNVKIKMFLNIPKILEGASSSIIHIFLPSDWNNLNIINHSVNFKFLNKTRMLNEYTLGNYYKLNVSRIEEGILEAWTLNHLSNIITPTDISRNEVIEIRGDLHYPLPGYINLFLQNGSFIYHQTTLPMINSTFIFPKITITDQFPLGIVQLTLNWSYSHGFGIFKKLVYIHEDVNLHSLILFQSPQNIDIHQFEPLLINLSLLKNGNKYSTNSTLVFLFMETEWLLFFQTSNNDYILNVSHIIWNPGDYTLDIIASDGNLFFAKNVVNITVEPASIFWSFENLKTEILKNESINFRVYSYVVPQGSLYFKILSGLIIRIWINDTIVSTYQTNLYGFSDVEFYHGTLIDGDFLQVVLEGRLGGEVVKLQTVLFLISNETVLNSGDRAYIKEITRSVVKANETFYIYYTIEYLSNNSNWFIQIETFSDLILSAFILRDNYVVGAHIEDEKLIWTLKADPSIKDTLVLELPSPTVLVRKESLGKKFRLKILTESKLTINNYTIEINLQFLGFTFSNISLFDSLNRDITNLFPMTIKGTFISFFNLNIIAGLEICYFLEGYLHTLEIVIKKPFLPTYMYNESIIGSWKFSAQINSSYSVIYTILGLGSWECYNTSLKVFSNASSIVTAFLPPQKWNYSISIQLIVKYHFAFIIGSSFQNFSIRDPFPPTLDYSIEPLVNLIRIHAFVFEPDRASGIKNVSLLIGEENYSSLNFSSYHFEFEIPTVLATSSFIKIKVFDRAGNERTTDFIDINNFISNSSSLFMNLATQFLFSTLFSVVIVSSILFSRIIRRRRASIL
ncbi:MAG: hypothetical protein ACFFBQ_01965 [Promethearchaeota archaeon]